MVTKTIRQRVFDYLDKFPNDSPTIIAKKLKVKYNSVRSAKGAWKLLRGYVVGTKHEPMKTLIKRRGKPQKALRK